MALAKGRATQDSNITSIQRGSYFFEESSDQLSGLSSPGSYGVVMEKGVDNGEKNSSNFVFGAMKSYYQPDEAHSVINFKNGYEDSKFMQNGQSLLNFGHNSKKDDYSKWEENLNQNQNQNYEFWNQSNDNPRLLEDFNCFQTASNYSSEATLMVDSIQDESDQTHEAAGFHKRLLLGENIQVMKKQCTGTSRKTKPKSVAQSKDPQSIAAKNRRERISERLKVLQELVPNGSKVDLVTMLEKAISYVKFLQLQVKVLATDEFWPVQGGKAPDISQVKEAIDAILSSQLDRNSSSNL